MSGWVVGDIEFTALRLRSDPRLLSGWVVGDIEFTALRPATRVMPRALGPGTVS